MGMKAVVFLSLKPNHIMFWILPTMHFKRGNAVSVIKYFVQVLFGV